MCEIRGVLGLAVAAAIGALGGPFSIVIPLLVHGLMRLGPRWATQDDADDRMQRRAMQLHLGAIELVSVWAAVSVTAHWIARDGHYVVVGGLVAVVASTTTVALVGATRVANNALVALVPAAAVASAVAAIAARLVL